MIVLLTLTIAGSDTGPFDLYSDLDSYITAFETGVSKIDLEAGYTTEAPDYATIIRIISTGDCINSTDITLSDVDCELDGYVENITTTTTTTSLPPIACGIASSYSGNNGYPLSQSVTLGTDTGNVTYTFDALSVPDRFITKWNSIIVIDTGYRGTSTYDFGGGSRASFNASLTGDVDPVTLTTYPDVVNFPDDGYPRVTSPGSGTTSFNKNLASPTLAIVDVYAPISGTAWEFIMSCPEVTTTTTTTTI